MHFSASRAPLAQEALARLTDRYGQVERSQADVVIVLGGDGFMLEALHAELEGGLPVYGMNRGSVGFLMNAYREDGLPERLARASELRLHPLAMRAHLSDGKTWSALALNEVAVTRDTRQAAKLRILVDGKIRMDELTADGVLVATPAGSTAYNLSAHGPILPIGSRLLALTPISAFRPRRWRGALLPETAHVEVQVLEVAKRPVLASADSCEVKGVERVEVAQSSEHESRMLYDPEHNLEERILMEQFQD